jgi:hypothetical protein
MIIVAERLIQTRQIADLGLLTFSQQRYELGLHISCLTPSEALVSNP